MNMYWLGEDEGNTLIVDVHYNSNHLKDCFLLEHISVLSSHFTKIQIVESSKINSLKLT